MNGNHISGGTLAALIGAVAARYGWDVSDQEAVAIGGALAVAGGVVAHVVTGPGLLPAIRRGIHGPAKTGK